MRARQMLYWFLTVAVAFENTAGFSWVYILRNDYLGVMLAHLGYPPYFQYLIGAWQLACAAALLAPGMQVAKEWAYAGAFFNYSSAFVSHLCAGDKPDAPSAIMILLTIGSWALRPADRRFAAASVPRKSARSWTTSAGIFTTLMLLSLFSAPRR